MPLAGRRFSGRVLIVDDEAALRRALGRLLARLGLEIETAADGIEAEERLRASRFDLCITDLRMPRADGFAVLRAASACVPRVPVVILTGHGTVSTAVEAMRAGALNFLTKPFNIEELEAVVGDALKREQTGLPGAEEPTAGAGGHRRAEEPAASMRGAVHKEGFTGLSQAATRSSGAAALFVGEHPKVRDLLALVERIADTESTVLITGESGTGKEVLARVLHATSPRAAGPFVALNCAAIPESLVESELFGYARGAFTGATEARKGRVAMAERGTLFLDEIGEMPLGLQAKLLRLLQEREYSPVGDSRALKADIRVIAATNADLERRVVAGSFRPDLYYRLNVIAIEIPPLRERKEDIPLLAQHFLRRANEKLGRKVTGFAAGVLDVLLAYGWPGNVRELENAIERAVAFRKEGLAEIEDLPPRIVEKVRTAYVTGHDGEQAAVGYAGGKRSRPAEGIQGKNEDTEPRGPVLPAEGEAAIGQAGRGDAAAIGQAGPADETASVAAEGGVMQGAGSGVVSLTEGALSGAATLGEEIPVQGSAGLRTTPEEIEDRMILDALRRTGGNKTQAARLLWMKRTTLIQKIKRRKLRVE